MGFETNEGSIVLIQRLRRRIFGILGLAAVLGCAGTALAIDMPLPKRKPVIGAEITADAPDFILQAVPVRKPAQAGALPAENAEEEKGEVVFITRALPPRKPQQQTVVMKRAPGTAQKAETERIAAAVQAAQEDKPSTVPAALLDKKPSLLERVFSKFSSGRRLSGEDAARYAHIFAFQDTGDFAQANAEIEKLSDMRLMGHVLQQRYLGPGYRATYDELLDWMKRYADYPDAQKVYDLAKKRRLKDAAWPQKPRTSRGVYGMHDFDVGQLAQPYISNRSHGGKQRDLIRAVSRTVSCCPTSSLKKLEAGKAALGAASYDALQADIAASYFFNGKGDKALELASASAARSGEDVPLAGWISGLVSWQKGEYAAAARYFEITGKSPRSSAWMSSAGSYWAARSHLRAREPRQVNEWLRRAAQYPRTFYGIIAMKALGMGQARFNWKLPELTDRHIKALSEVPAGWRALALVDAGQSTLAEQELRSINPGTDDVLQEAMIALANDAGMPGLAMRMGSAFRSSSGKLYDAALYPDVPWEPEKGFSVDRSLVYAFIRQESKFQINAKNKSSGAQGLMQLMPRTAKHVANQHGDVIERGGLQDPTLNIDLGQKYISELLKNDYVGNNLFKLAVAYNAGPGRLARWDKEERYAGDPLLFIESIPAAETRIFVERVLANYWIYRIKYGQDAVSLNMVAEGNWPVYVAQDDRPDTLLAAAKQFFNQ